MIKRNQRYFNWINRLLDMAIYYVGYVLAVWFWLFLLDGAEDNIAVRFAFENRFPLLLLTFLFMVFYQGCGMYDSFRFRKLHNELWQVFKLHLMCIMFGIGCIFLFKQSDFSRGVMVTYSLFSYILLCLKRVVLRTTLHYIRKTGQNQKHVLLVGDGVHAQSYLDSIEANPHYGFQCIGYVGESSKLERCRCLGTYEALSDLLEQEDPDEVIIALEDRHSAWMSVIILNAEKHGIRTSIIPSFSELLPSCATVDSIADVRLINLRGITQDITLNKILKRCFDIVFSLFVILLTSPVMLVTWIGVTLSSPGPALFKQVRMGKERKHFTMYKFRSMRENSESDTAWSRDNDSRRTRFGALIRKLSIDELPQFFNVLKGDMSVVGPRPELPHFVDKYKDMFPLYMVKHQVKPGITGWAQVNGFRGDTSIEKRVEYDIWYIEHWSFILDMKIIFLTVFGGMVNKEKIVRKKREEQTV